MGEDVLPPQRDCAGGKKGGFSREFIERLQENMMTAFWEAIQRPGSTVGRGRLISIACNARC